MHNIRNLLTHYAGANAAERILQQVEFDPALLRPASDTVIRSELAQALNMILFDELVQRVPAAQAYVEEVVASGARVNFDHGAMRTVAWPSGALPPGEASVTRILRALGFRLNETYPLDALKMTGRSWCHVDFPAQIAQYFVSELHPERFSEAFQNTVTRVIGNSRDPLTATDIGLLEELSRDRELPCSKAQALLPSLVACFARQHAIFSWADYELLLRESPEMAWIATEGNVFNHATSRVQDVDAVAQSQRKRGRPIKDVVEVSRSGRVRQTAFRATEVSRDFYAGASVVQRNVPGSFFEFITRQEVQHADGTQTLDLAFDAGNATAIFAMTAAEVAV